MGQSKLTLQVLSAYLPYGVQVYDTIYQMSRPLIGHSVQRFMTRGILPESEKLLLRPLSDLTTEIEHNGKWFVPIHELFKTGISIEECKESIDELTNQTAPSVSGE